MTLFVAEFTTNHLGNFNLLLRMAEQAAWAGCSFIKMQKKDVASFYSAEKLDAHYESPYGKTYRDYRSIFEFDDEDFRRFDVKCRSMGVAWFCTVQDAPSLRFMQQFETPFVKIASSNARNRPFLEECARQIPTDRDLVLSVAGSTLEEVEQALEIFPDHRIWLLHCVAQYPCPPHALRLGNIEVLKARFGSDRVRVGYSGHEEGIEPSLAAVALGAELVERHFCLSRFSFVHHIECSLEPEEFRELVEAAASPMRLEAALRALPEAALAARFGMADAERPFLVEQTYGRKYVGDATEFPDDVAHPAAATASRRMRRVA